MDTKLLTRISKLLALGNGSSFDGEAATALQKAYALWLKTMRPELVKSSLRSSYRDGAAYTDGKKDGANINLSRQFAQQALPCD